MCFLSAALDRGDAMLSWTDWDTQVKKFVVAKERSLERWFLRYLHSTDILKELAESLALSVPLWTCIVNVRSVWIDGTPQALGKTVSGKTVKCELADLLIIIQNWDSTSGRVTRRRGILLQAKLCERFGRLSGGRSTANERDLLELLDRSKPLALFKDTKRTSLLNPRSQYVLSKSTLVSSSLVSGLADCSSYLLFPSRRFKEPFIPYHPFVLGWPKCRSIKSIKPATSVEQAFNLLSLGRMFGRDVLDQSLSNQCEWTRMVYDLLGGYASLMMRPSAPWPFPRVNNISIKTTKYAQNTLVMFRRHMGGPPTADILDDTIRQPPYISVIVADVHSSDVDPDLA